ncbi:MAG: AAA family ATPase [Actinomycetota bacterium]
MGSLLVVTGPPGAGKSSVAALLAADSDTSVLVEGDRFFEFLASGAIEPWQAAADHQNRVVTEAAALAAGRFAASYDTVYDGVVGPWFLSAFAAATGLAELAYVILLPPVETCVTRVRGRIGHGFTDEAATRSMHRSFAAAEIDRRHVLADRYPDPQAAAAAVRVARSAGRLHHRPS